MTAANRAKSARAKATIAARLLKTNKRVHRSFHDCFENFDGAEVRRILVERAAGDHELRTAMRRHGLTEAAEEAERLAATRTHFNFGVGVPQSDQDE